MTIENSFPWRSPKRITAVEHRAVAQCAKWHPEDASAAICGCRLLFEQLVYRVLRIATDYQPLLCGAAFTLLALRFWFLGHLLVVLSRRFPTRVEVVPQPGIEPGRPCRSRECKSRLSTSSSTGAYRSSLDVGAVMAVKSSAAPTWFFRPFSAALLPSSCHASFSRRNHLGDLRNQVPSDRAGFSNASICQSVFLAAPFAECG